MNTPPDITALRADYDEKWAIYDEARQEALAKAEASVAHLRVASARAYRVLRAACRSKIC
jgi:hypothetical protein